MAVEVVDLCDSSSEDNESPRKFAEGALAGFQPRKEKARSSVAKVNGASAASDRTHTGEHWRLTKQVNIAHKEHEEQNKQSHVDHHVNRHVSGVLGGWHELGTRANNETYQHKQSFSQASPFASSPNGAGGDLDDSVHSFHGHTAGSLSYRKRTGKGDAVRTFRVDKSERYARENGTGRTSSMRTITDRNNPVEHSASRIPSRRSMEAQTDDLFLLQHAAPGLEAERAAKKVDDASGIKARSGNVRPPTTSLLSGAGLEIVRAQEDPTSTSNLLSLENGVKRPVSPQEDEFEKHRTKRHRAGGDLRNEKTVLIDVTNPGTERVTYSDEPEFERMPTQKPTSSSAAKKTLVSSNLGKKRADFSSGPNRNGVEYSAEEDELLYQLKQEGLPWKEIQTYFNGRTLGSLQVRYSSKLARRDQQAAANHSRPGRKKSGLARPPLEHADSSDNATTGRGKRLRKSAVSTMDGFVSWASLKNSTEVGATPEAEEVVNKAPSEQTLPNHLLRRDNTFPSSMSRILRYRELGLAGRRSWCASPRTVPDEMKNHVYKKYDLRKQYHGTSGDVVALAWAPDGEGFAAGSIAISDDRSMQYNMQRNLLVGSRSRAKLRELVDHHVPRPLIDESDNVNGLHAMRASQDQRLFKTVTATAFSLRGSRKYKLYTTGEDMMLRRYSVAKDLTSVKCRYTIQHPARVDLLAVSSPHGIVATGCHTSSESVRLYRCHERDYELGPVFSPGGKEFDSTVPTFPSTLKWGLAYQHCSLLLAGFSGDEEKEYVGETCLWDVNTRTQITLRSATRNVFDVAWNPNPSPASIVFAVASKTTSLSVGRDTRSVIQCFAPDQQECRKVLTWECPAADINDVLFCPYDQNLIAAGATNGTVYIWDQRSVKKSQGPLHILHHGFSENIIAHDRDPETADTGVRFLSWGATKTRLYSGSHDGIVKVWNPYRSPDNAHVDDIAPPRHERSAVMSGTFNSDHRELLLGTENGRINLFSIEGGAVYKPRQFKLQTAPQPTEDQQDPYDAARSMIDSERIEIRTCGAMPFRQAVQGPNYDGPYLAPSTEQITDAEAFYNVALIEQNDAHLRRPPTNLDNDDDDAEILKANNKVLSAQQTLNDLQAQLDHFMLAEPKALKFQQTLRKAEQSRAQLLSQVGNSPKPCKLQCTVLPHSDEVEDSCRSELRIPHALRSIHQDAARSLVGDEESDAACASCFPLKAVTRKKGARTFCANCRLKRVGLTASCARCSGPARLETETAKQTLCELCAFTCFRCNGAVFIDEETTSVRCTACQLTWDVGILGYELVTAPERRQRRLLEVEEDDSKEHDDFGTLDREHYASLWQDADADEMMGY